ncbi:TPA: hypothetical protein ACKQH2_000316 [Serratia marcescens]
MKIKQMEILGVLPNQLFSSGKLKWCEGRTQITTQCTEKYKITKNKARLCPLLCPQYKFRETLED